MMNFIALSLAILDSVPPAAKVLGVAAFVYGLIQLLKVSPLVGPHVSGWVAIVLNVIFNAVGAVITIPAAQLYTANSLLLIIGAALGSAGIHGTVSKLSQQAKPAAGSTQRLAAWALIMLILMPGVQGCTAAQVTTAVNDVAQYLPTVIALITDGLQIWGAVGTSGSATAPVVSGALNTVQADGVALQKLVADYQAASSSAEKQTAWTEIEAATSTFANDANAIFQLAALKDPATQQQALLIISSINAAVNVIAGMVMSAQSTTQIKAAAAARAVKVSELEKHWSAQDRAMISSRLNVPYPVAVQWAEARGF